MPVTTARATRDPRTGADVWKALTDPEQIRRYFLGGAEVRTDWKVATPSSSRANGTARRSRTRARSSRSNPSVSSRTRTSAR